MAYAYTPWGYEVDGTMASLVSESDFNDMTGSRWSGDERIGPALSAASAAVRNACGWHVAPSMSCRVTLDSDGQRCFWLPATHVTAVSSVTVDGTELGSDAYQWSRIGQLVLDDCATVGLRMVVVEYTAGFAATADLASIAAGVASRAIALSPGVTSETAGGVSVSYSSAASIAPYATLLDIDRASLAQYRAVMAHAT